MIGVGQKGDLGYGELSIRAGFNDLLDRPDGYPQHFDLEGLSASVRVYESDSPHKQVVLQDLTLLRGRSFNPINSGRSGKNWGLNLGATRVNDGSEPNGTEHLVANTTFELGQSVAFGTPRAGTGELPPQLCYALGNASAQVGKGINNGWRAGIGINLGCRYQVSPKLRAHAEVAVPYWYHGDIDQTADSKLNSEPSVITGNPSPASAFNTTSTAPKPSVYKATTNSKTASATKTTYKSPTSATFKDCKSCKNCKERLLDKPLSNSQMV